jgi:hypothetical protein
VSQPLQQAQIVWRRALDVSDPVKAHDALAAALELLRSARHDGALLAHALLLGRTRVRDHPQDIKARRGVTVLERGIAFLGVKPEVGDAVLSRQLVGGKSVKSSQPSKYL